MKSLPMLANILAQPASHRAVLSMQSGAGAEGQAAAAAILRRSEGRVLISGMGASYFAAIPFLQALQAAGRQATAVESSELLYAPGTRWRTGDCAVLISRSGGSIEVLKLAESLRAEAVPVIGVTNVPGSPLTQLADATLILGSLPDELIAVQSYTATVLALLLLADVALNGSSATLEASLTTSLPLLEQLIQAALDHSDGWRSVLAEAQPLYLLGRGGTTATLHEGSLLLHETAKAAAVAMASGQFRHGPVEVVDPRFRAIVVGTDERTHHLDWKLALDLERMGGRVLWLGPRDSSQVSSTSSQGTQPSLTPMIPWPDRIPKVLLPLFDIVPLQVAAFRTAEWRGIVAGAFRFASEVTENEESFPFFEAALR